MSTLLQFLRSKPDKIVSRLILEMSGDRDAVVCLYPDEITGDPVDWDRLVEDIMSLDRLIKWG